VLVAIATLTGMFRYPHCWRYLTICRKARLVQRLTGMFRYPHCWRYLTICRKARLVQTEIRR
jgi:hypothetical protein